MMTAKEFVAYMDALKMENTARNGFDLYHDEDNRQIGAVTYDGKRFEVSFNTFIGGNGCSVFFHKVTKYEVDPTDKDPDTQEYTPYVRLSCGRGMKAEINVRYVHLREDIKEYYDAVIAGEI